MKLQKREKLLLGAAGILVAFIALIVFFATGDARTDDFLRTEHDRLQGEVQKKEKQVKDAEEDQRQLAEWRRRSLPRDALIAQSLYQAWLLTLCDRAGLRGSEVHAETTEPHRDVYTRIPFSIRARANLSQIVNFLQGFYSAGNLQQVRRMEIKPIQNSNVDFDLRVNIEALSLRDADSSEELTKETGEKVSSLTADRQAVVERNFFAAYVPQRILPRDTGQIVRVKPPDLARFAVFSGIIQDKDDGKWRVWLYDRAAGKKLELKEGESFTVRGGTGQIRSIVPDNKVILQFNGKLRELELGNNLLEGSPL